MGNIRKVMRDLRRDFNLNELHEGEIPDDPIVFLKSWLAEAIEANIKDANAFILSTSNNNKPDSRVLLVRDIHHDGIQFYTNYGSKKAKDIASNPNGHVTFFWPELERQIRIVVHIEKLDSKSSDEYFNSRPRASQIGAWASRQSEDLTYRSTLEKRVKELEVEFEGKEIPRPDFWGGYLAKPSEFEFWQGRPSRLHDRIVFAKLGEEWSIKRLYP